jgi:hypothetical protein
MDVRDPRCTAPTARSQLGPKTASGIVRVRTTALSNIVEDRVHEDTEKSSNDELSEDGEEGSINELASELALETSDLRSKIASSKKHSSTRLLRCLRGGLSTITERCRFNCRNEPTAHHSFDAEVKPEIGIADVDARLPVERRLVDVYSNSFMLYLSRIGDFVMSSIADTAIIVIVAIASLLSSLVDPHCRYDMKSHRYEPVSAGDSIQEAYICDSAGQGALRTAMTVLSLPA